MSCHFQSNFVELFVRVVIGKAQISIEKLPKVKGMLPSKTFDMLQCFNFVKKIPTKYNIDIECERNNII